jgi:5-methylthioribose kinase
MDEHQGLAGASEDAERAMKGEFIVYGLLGWLVLLLIAVLWLEMLARMDDKRFREEHRGRD